MKKATIKDLLSGDNVAKISSIAALSTSGRIFDLYARSVKKCRTRKLNNE